MAGNNNPHKDPRPTIAQLIAESKRLRAEAARIHAEMQRLAQIIEDRLVLEAAEAEVAAGKGDYIPHSPRPRGCGVQPGTA
jgi:hypothetical protein